MNVCRFEFSVSMVELHRRTLDVAVKNGGSILSKHKGLLGKVTSSPAAAPGQSAVQKLIYFLLFAGAGRFKWWGHIKRMDSVVNVYFIIILCSVDWFLLLITLSIQCLNIYIYYFLSCRYDLSEDGSSSQGVRSIQDPLHTQWNCRSAVI